nr:hypothetical protein [Tessaracoccus coleopterorum]
MPFFIYAAAVTVAVAVVAIFLRGGAGGRPLDDVIQERMTLKEALGLPYYRALLYTGFAHGWSNFGVRIALLPLMAAAIPAIGEAAAGIALTLFALGNAVTQQATGRLIDKRGRRPSSSSASASPPSPPSRSAGSTPFPGSWARHPRRRGCRIHRARLPGAARRPDRLQPQRRPGALDLLDGHRSGLHRRHDAGGHHRPTDRVRLGIRRHRRRDGHGDGSLVPREAAHGLSKNGGCRDAPSPPSSRHCWASLCWPGHSGRRSRSTRGGRGRTRRRARRPDAWPQSGPTSCSQPPHTLL